MFAQLRASLNTWFDHRFPIPEPPPTIILLTGRLLLRDMEADDLPLVCACLSDPEVLRYLKRKTPYSEQQTRMMIYGARKQVWQKPRDNYIMAVVIRETNQLIGECS